MLLNLFKVKTLLSENPELQNKVKSLLLKENITFSDLDKKMNVEIKNDNEFMIKTNEANVFVKFLGESVFEIKLNDKSININLNDSANDWMKKVQSLSPHQTSGLLNFFIEEAHAFWPIAIVLVGAIVAAISFFVKYSMQNSKKAESMALAQLSKAIEICDKVDPNLSTYPQFKTQATEQYKNLVKYYNDNCSRLTTSCRKVKEAIDCLYDISMDHAIEDGQRKNAKRIEELKTAPKHEPVYFYMGPTLPR